MSDKYKVSRIGNLAHRGTEAVIKIHRIIKREGDAVPVSKIAMHLADIEEALKDIERLCL